MSGYFAHMEKLVTLHSRHLILPFNIAEQDK